MVARAVRIYYSNRLEATRYACDFRLSDSGGGTIRIGSDPKNELVLPGRHVPRMAAALVFAGSSWGIEPFDGSCSIEGRDVCRGRRWPVSSHQEIRLGEFTLALHDLDPSSASDEVDREAFDRRAGDLVAILHGKLLSRLPRIEGADTPQANDERLLDIEHSIDELCARSFKTIEMPLIDHLAGLAIRAELLGKIIESEEGRRLSPLTERSPWSKFVSAVPELERDLDRLIRSLGSSLVVSSSASVRDRIEQLDRSFWPTWERLGRPMIDAGVCTYLARRYCKKEIKDLVFGFGPIEDLLRMPTIDEIMVNDSSHIFIEHCGVLKNSGRRFVSDAVTAAIIERIVARVGRRIDRSQPIVDARMPDGSRINAVIPPIAVGGPTLTIRKFRAGGFSIAQLIELGSLTPTVARFLRAAVRARRNILVSGGTGTGKTTLLNCLGGWVPETERIVTVEDTAEMMIDHPHVVRMETRSKNLEGQGALTIRDLVRNALRMRPDRIIVGECRGAEALDMLQAMNTGHDGSLTTIHANSTTDVVQRLEGMILEAAPLPIPAIHRQVASAVDLVVQLERRGPVKRVSEISEMAGYDSKRGVIRIRHLFQVDPDSGQIMPTGSMPTFVDALIRDGGLAIESFYGDPDAEADAEENDSWT